MKETDQSVILNKKQMLKYKFEITVVTQQKSGKNYHIIHNFQLYKYRKMQGIFNAPFDILLIPQLSQMTFDSSFFYPGNEELLSSIYGNKQMIEKLLENQIFLKTQFHAPMRFQTTDTQHSRHESDSFEELQSIQKSENSGKKLNNIVLNQKKQCLIGQRKTDKKKIEIVCSYPMEQNYIDEQLQQNTEKKQFQKNREQIKKCCETKNIIKNYGKSILMFLRRNKTMTKKILDQYEYNETQFYEEFQKFKDRVNSITELKTFWTQEGNPFAKVYRIISNIYLKKFSLKHTFSSRVKNYSVHIKYRKRLLDVLKNPEKFSSIKYL